MSRPIAQCLARCREPLNKERFSKQINMISITFLNGEVWECSEEEWADQTMEVYIARQLQVSPEQLCVQLLHPPSTYMALILPRKVCSIELDGVKPVRQFEWLRTCRNESILRWWLSTPSPPLELFANPHPLAVEWILDRLRHQVEGCNGMEDSIANELCLNPHPEVVEMILSHPEWQHLGMMAKNENESIIDEVLLRMDPHDLHIWFELFHHPHHTVAVEKAFSYCFHTAVTPLPKLPAHPHPRLLDLWYEDKGSFSSPGWLATGHPRVLDWWMEWLDRQLFAAIDYRAAQFDYEPWVDWLLNNRHRVQTMYLSRNPHPKMIAYLQAHPEDIELEQLVLNPSPDAVKMSLEQLTYACDWDRQMVWHNAIRNPNPDMMRGLLHLPRRPIIPDRAVWECFSTSDEWDLSICHRKVEDET